eukprot:Rmarinus@m.3462
MTDVLTMDNDNDDKQCEELTLEEITELKKQKQEELVQFFALSKSTTETFRKIDEFRQTKEAPFVFSGFMGGIFLSSAAIGGGLGWAYLVKKGASKKNVKFPILRAVASAFQAVGIATLIVGTGAYWGGVYVKQVTGLPTLKEALPSYFAERVPPIRKRIEAKFAFLHEDTPPERKDT